MSGYVLDIELKIISGISFVFVSRDIKSIVTTIISFNNGLPDV